MAENQEQIADLVRLRSRLMETRSIFTSRALDELLAEIEGRLASSTQSSFDQKSQVVETQVNIAQAIYQAPRLPAVEPDTARYVYLNWVKHRSENVPLRGLELSPTTGNPNLARGQRMRLSRIYVELETMSMIADKQAVQDEWSIELADWSESVTQTRPMTVLEAIRDHKRVVLLGAPGSGKTTFTRHLALCLSSAQIEGVTDWVPRLSGWKPDEWGLLPVVVNLRDFDRWLKRRSSSGNARLFWDFIEELLKSIRLDGFFPAVQEDIYKGRAIVFLDGLDEVDQAKRPLVRNAVLDLADCCESRIVTTCRILSYSDKRWQLEGFTHFEISPLHAKQVSQFVELWHAELVQTGAVLEADAQELKVRLTKALQDPDLSSMISNPLLLDSTSLVHTYEGYLPHPRALLYEACVDLLLWNWEQLKLPGGLVQEPMGIRSLLYRAGLEEIDFKQAFWRLAYDSFSSKNSEFVIQDLVAAFCEIHPKKDWNWANDVVVAIQQRAGLLAEHAPGRFSFSHRTFHEYLAASHLSAQTDFSHLAAGLANDDAWREVILLAAGRLVHISGDVSKPIALVSEMFSHEEREIDPRYGLFAAEILAEVGTSRIADRTIGRNLLREVRTSLCQWAEEGIMSVRDRKRLGTALSRHGDPRFDANLGMPQVFHGQQERFLGFVLIRPGPFVMGVERDAHSTPLPGYFMSRYPVTEGQYWQFIQETNRTHPAHWLSGRPSPDRLNCPVVNVSWYDCMAYCHWLTQRLRHYEFSASAKEIWNCTDKLVLIPSEAEWEKACRSDVGAGTFAWNDDFSPDRANVKELGLGESVAVGLFPLGASPYGILDLGGNVREWTTTRYWDDDKKQYGMPYDPRDGREDLERNDNVTRVLKGGAYHLEHYCAGCSYRTRNFPLDRHPYLGFRLVIHCKCPAPLDERNCEACGCSV